MVQINRPTLHDAILDASRVLVVVKPHGGLADAIRVANEALHGRFDLRDAACEIAASIEAVGCTHDMRLAYVWRMCREASDPAFLIRM